MVIFGDSISTKNHGNGGYEEGLKEGLKLDKITNLAVGSSGLTMSTPNSMAERIKKSEILEDTDFFLIWHGTNDWYWGSELSLFEQEMIQSVSSLRKLSPSAYIIWILPIYRREAADGCKTKGNAWVTRNKAGAVLKDYGEIIKKVSKRMKFDYLDISEFFTITEENAEVFLEDGVHPNEKGYERITEVLISQLNKVVR